MRILIAVAVLAAAVLAQGADAPAKEADKLVQRAKQLETRAAKALDAGRNVEAFELLAQAEELRRQARAAAPARTAPAKKKAAPAQQPRKAKKKKAKAAPAAPDALTKAFASLDRAIEMGDQASARRASKELKKLLRKRSKAPAPKADQALLRRVERLEKQLAELRQLLAQIDR